MQEKERKTRKDTSFILLNMEENAEHAMDIFENRKLKTDWSSDGEDTKKLYLMVSRMPVLSWLSSKYKGWSLVICYFDWS